MRCLQYRSGRKGVIIVLGWGGRQGAGVWRGQAGKRWILPPLRWKPIDKVPNWKCKKQCVPRDTEGKYHAYQGKEMKTFASAELVVQGGADGLRGESWPAWQNLQATRLRCSFMYVRNGPRAAVTNAHRLGAQNNTNPFSPSSGGQKPKIKELAGPHPL